MSDVFSHINVLFGLITGFGISEVFSAWGRMIRQRDEIKFYWLHFLWMLITFLLLLQFWWGTWEYRNIEAWSFPHVLLELAALLGPVLALFVLIPDIGDQEDRDMHRHYWHNKRWFFLLGAATLVLLTVENLLVLNVPLLHEENYIRAGILALTLLLAFSEREWLHIAVSLAVVALFVLFMLLTLTVVA